MFFTSTALFGFLQRTQKLHPSIHRSIHYSNFLGNSGVLHTPGCTSAAIQSDMNLMLLVQLFDHNFKFRNTKYHRIKQGAQS